MKRYTLFNYARVRVAVCLLMLTGTVNAQEKKEQTGFDVSRNLEIFADIYRQLDMFYVDTLSADTAIRWAIDGMLSEIDPYTTFYPGDDQDDLRRMATGRYAGIGALIRAYKKENRTVIEEPYEGCPAQEVGVRSGDVILSIDGKDIEGWPVSCRQSWFLNFFIKFLAHFSNSAKNSFVFCPVILQSDSIHTFMKKTLSGSRFGRIFSISFAKETNL